MRSITVKHYNMELLNKASYRLCIKNPFYGIFLAELNKSYSDRIPTACVTKSPNSNQISLLVNEKTYAALTDNQRVSRLAHEVLHCMFGHFFMGDILNVYPINNIAMDMCINQILIVTGFDKIQGWQLPESYPDLHLKKNEGSEYYYKELLKAKSKKDDTGTSGDKVFDKMIDSYVDDHSEWKTITKNMTELERELLQRKVESAVRSAADQYPGNIPVQLKGLINDLLNVGKPTVPWTRILRQFIGSTTSSELYQTRKRPNFRFPDSPATKNKFTTNIIFSVDSSGSISDEQYELFFNEIYHAHKVGTKIRIHLWDTKVHMEYDYDGKAIMTRCCQGGTDASDSIEKANKQRSKYDALIILTDGHIPPPVRSTMPTLWVVTRDGSMEFEHNGKKIRM